MAKISLQDLSSVLVERRHIGKKEASQFVNEMFYLIQKNLNEDKIVKVKGLGTFKIIDVEDRESVDVNTGDRVLIEGHGKITFTPDALMKELVNKPFSQFETVVLKDRTQCPSPNLNPNLNPNQRLKYHRNQHRNHLWNQMAPTRIRLLLLWWSL